MWSRYREAAMAMAKAIVRGRLRYLILHVTSRCNARCRMCFNWDGMTERREQRVLSLENIVKLAQSVAGLPQLSCSGGEPLLRDDLADILNVFYEHAGTRFFTVPTNALQPERVEMSIERFAKDCPNAFLNFCLPFHGPEGVFDDVMGIEGAFERMRASYDVIVRARKLHDNVSCTLNFVMSKFNHEYYRQIIDLAKEQFPEGALGIAFARGQTHERDAVEFPIETYEKAQEYLASQKSNKHGLNPYTVVSEAVARQIWTTVLSVVGGKRADLACHAGRSLLVVYDNGDVFPCEMLDAMNILRGEGSPVTARMGNLGDYDFNLAALLSGEDARRVLDWTAEHSCACTWECAIFNEILHSPAQLARLSALCMCHIIGRS